jgi:hypothetical protein
MRRKKPTVGDTCRTEKRWKRNIGERKNIYPPFPPDMEAM